MSGWAGGTRTTYSLPKNDTGATVALTFAGIEWTIDGSMWRVIETRPPGMDVPWLTTVPTCTFLYSTGLLRATAVDDAGSSAVTSTKLLNAPPKEAKTSTPAASATATANAPHHAYRGVFRRGRCGPR